MNAARQEEHMKILVTGAKGFVGRNLCAELYNIANGKRRVSPLNDTPEVLEYDIGSSEEELREYCRTADFAVNLAGVNRPRDDSEFMRGNFGFADTLLGFLEECGNNCPVLMSSSIQAALDNPYGLSKRAGEERFFEHGRKTGAPVYVYRFPNVFGKWCRPNYNSAIATFCHNTAHGLPIKVNDPSVMMHLVYIDDVVEEILRAIGGSPNWEGEYCRVPVQYDRPLGEVASAITGFTAQRKGLFIPEVSDPFIKKLYSAYLSYVPAEEAAVPCEMKRDERGSFTELLRTEGMGQVSVNVCRPGFTKGNHWHHTKAERFIVVSGSGVIRERRIGSGEVTEIPVSGDEISSVDMLPGYTHSIENTGESDLVFMIWANERFDPERPDTFFEKVLQED